METLSLENIIRLQQEAGTLVMQIMLRAIIAEQRIQELEKELALLNKNNHV